MQPVVPVATSCVDNLICLPQRPGSAKSRRCDVYWLSFSTVTDKSHPMTPRFHFTLEPDWRTAPLAFWVHVTVTGSDKECVPSAPVEVLHKGFVVLHVDAADVDLQFSSLAQLDHFIEVMVTKPLPTSRQLSRKRELPVGPNSHWLSRLPVKLKAPKERAKLVSRLEAVREQLSPLSGAWHRYSRFL